MQYEKNGSCLKGVIGLVLVLGLLAACSSPSPVASPVMKATPPQTVQPSPTPAEVPDQVVTLDNDGQTITLQIGERFLLQLGEDYDWTVTVADPTILSRVGNVLVVRGAQGLYEAHEPGSTTLTASGDPACRRLQPPCARPSRLFEVSVEVK